MKKIYIFVFSLFTVFSATSKEIAVVKDNPKPDLFYLMKTASNLQTQFLRSSNFALVSNDASLSGLTISNTTSLGFDPNTLSYSVITTTNSIANVTVSATANESHASVSFSAPSPVTLGARGSTTTINITVTAEDGVTTKTYSVAVFRKNSQTITLASGTASKTFGDAAFSTGATSTSALPITYSSDYPSVASVDGNGMISILSAATATVKITVKQAGDATHDAAGNKILTITISKKLATLAVSNTSQTYDGNPKSITVVKTPSVLATLAISYGGDSNPPIDAGTYAMTFELFGNDSYYIDPASVNLVIAKAAQTVTFSTAVPSQKTFGDADFTVVAGSTSALTVAFESSNTNVATIDAGGIIHIVGAGDVTITAKQAGNGNYLAAADVAMPLTVKKAAATVTLADLSKTYNTSPQGATVTTDAVGTSTFDITYGGNATEPTDVGSYAIQATLINANYEAPVATGSLVIAKANQTISNFTNLNATFGDSPIVPTASATSSLAVAYTSSNESVATIDNGDITIVGAGDATITASQAGNANYNAATDVSVTLHVEKASASLAFDNLSAVYDGNAKVVTVTTTPASLDGVSIAYTGNHTDAGSYAVTASLSNANYTAADASDNLVIAKADQTITFDALTKIYGDADFASATATSDLDVTYSSNNTAVATIVSGQIHIVGAGTATITASQAGNGNYNAASAVDALLTVGKKEAGITIANLSQGYDGTVKPVVVTTDPSTFDGDLIIKYNGSANAPSQGGTYPVTVSLTNSPNYFSNGVTGNLVIAPAPQTVTFAALAIKTFNDADFAVSATSSQSLPITYSSDNLDVATVSGSTIHIVGAGSATITATQAGTNNYQAAFATQGLTVNKASASLAFTTLSAIYDGTSKSATAGSAVPNGSAATTGPISFAYTGIVGDPIAAGTYAVTASLTDDNYTADPITSQFEIAKADQTITNFADLNATFNDGSITPNATATSGLNVTYASSNTSVASIDGNIIIAGAGTANITASQAGDDNYNAATDVTVLLTVNKDATATLALSNLTQVYNGDAKAITVTTAPANLDGVSITYDGNASIPTTAGTYAVEASLTNDNYSAGNATGNLVIAKADQTITLSALTKIYGDADFSPATASSVDVVTYSSDNTAVATIVSGQIHIVGVGTANITASQIGNANYNTAPDVTVALNVAAKEAIITITNPSQVYNGSSKPVIITKNPSGLTGSLVIDYDGSSNAPVNAGVYPITFSLFGNNNYFVSNVPQSLEITKAPQSITFASLPGKTFGDATFTLSATSTSTFPVSFESGNTDVATISGTTVTIVGAGTATITAKQAGDSNFQAAPDAPQTLTVNQATASLAFGTLSATYDGTAKATTVTTTPASLTGVTITYTQNGNAVQPLAAGTYDITATLTNTNYAATAITNSFVIQKANQTITNFADVTKTFNDADFATAIATSNLGVTYASDNLDVASIVSGQIHIVGAGTANITASQAGDDNYNVATDVTVLLTVNKAATATLALSNLSQVYDSTAKVITVTTTPASLDGVSIAYAGNHTDAGSYAVTASLSNANYTAADASDNLVIAKADQTITFDALTKIYGDADFASATATSGLDVTYSSNNTAVATIVSGQIHIVGAGTATITASQAGNGNYNAASAVDALLTVGKKEAGITIANLSQVYDGTVRTVVVTTDPSTFDGDLIIKYNGSANAPSQGGTYPVTVSLVNSPNYFSNGVTQNLVIAPTAQTITFGALDTKTFGTDGDFTISATSTANLTVSFRSSNESVATISGNTVHIVGAGTAVISAMQAGTNNYQAATEIPQTLTVNGNPLPVSFISFDAKLNNAGSVDLTWLTASERNNSHFIVSKSTDGVRFIQLMKINGNGNSDQQNRYQTADKSPVNGNNYYQLVQYDNDGTATVLATKVVNVSFDKINEVSVYPNPVQNVVNVKFESNQYKTVKLISLNGVVLMTKSIDATQSEVSLEISNLPTATYIIQLNGKAGVFSKTIIKN